MSVPAIFVPGHTTERAGCGLIVNCGATPAAVPKYCREVQP